MRLECIDNDTGRSRIYKYLRAPSSITHTFQPSRNHLPNLEAKWNRKAQLAMLCSGPLHVRDLWARSSWGSGVHGVRGVRTVATYVNGPRDIWGNFNTVAVVALRHLNAAKG